MVASTRRTYAELYAHIRERAEARGNPLKGQKTFAQLFRDGYGVEVWGWSIGSDEPRQTRSYDTECGMRIYHPDTIYHGGYEWLAPLNTVSFGNTGGDGCHYSFITTPDGRWSEQSPVVLMVPPAGCRESGVVVVGENLWDFLGLGLRTGYFVLEDLALRFDEFLSVYPDRDPIAVEGDLEQTELAALAASFGLRGWERDRIGPRLAQLREQYYSQLVFAKC